jgi:hypothetical protein
VDYSWALRALRAGKLVRRGFWPGEVFIAVMEPSPDSDMTLPYFFMSLAVTSPDHTPHRIPWIATPADTIAEDWKNYAEYRYTTDAADTPAHPGAPELGGHPAQTDTQTDTGGQAETTPN